MALLTALWKSPLLTTFANTTFLFLCVAALLCLIGKLDLLKRMLRSRLVLAILILGSFESAGSRILVGYLGPGDIIQEFLGARELAAGRSMNPYDQTYMRSLVDYWVSRGPLDFGPPAWAPLRNLRASSIAGGAAQLAVQAHPPFHVLLLAPLAIVGSVRFMFVIMTLINVVTYLMLLKVIWDMVPDGQRLQLGLVLPLVLALGWQPFVANLRQGQVGIVVALLVACGWRCLKERPQLGGVLIGIAALVKMFPALLLVWLLLRNRRAFVSALCMVLAGGTLIYLLAGVHGFTDYIQAAKSVEAIYGRNRMNHSLSAVVGYVLAGPIARILWVSIGIFALEAALLGSQIWKIIRTPRPSMGELDLEFFGFIVLSCLLSPTCWAFYYPLLLVPLAAVLKYAAGPVAPRTIGGLLLILCCLSFPEQLAGQLTEGLRALIGDRLAWLLCSFPTFGMVALWYWIERRRDRVAAFARPA